MDAAKTSLLDSLGIEFVQAQAARLVRSQAALTDRIHTQSWALLERLEKDADKLDPLKAARVISALATATKLSGDSLRQVLTLGANTDDLEPITELIVRDYTLDELEEIRAEQDARWLAMAAGKNPDADGI